MRINISTEGKKYCIPFPTWLGLNRITVGIAFAYYREQLREKEIRLEFSDVYQFLRVFRKVERQYKGMCIVDVQSSDGDLVQIYL